MLICSSNFKLFAKYWNGSRRWFFKPGFVVWEISILWRKVNANSLEYNVGSTIEDVISVGCRE